MIFGHATHLRRRLLIRHLGSCIYGMGVWPIVFGSLSIPLGLQTTHYLWHFVCLYTAYGKKFNYFLFHRPNAKRLFDRNRPPKRNIEKVYLDIYTQFDGTLFNDHEPPNDFGAFTISFDVA